MAENVSSKYWLKCFTVIEIGEHKYGDFQYDEVIQIK